MLRSRFLWRLYGGFLLVILATGVLVGWLQWQWYWDDAAQTLERKVVQIAEDPFLEQLAQKSVSDSVPADLLEEVRSLGTFGAVRLTIIRADGTVVADSRHEAGTMDDHMDRPEIRSALASGDVALSQRESTTAGEEYLYAARVVRDAAGEPVGYVRAAVRYDLLLSRRQAAMTNVGIGLLLALAIASLLGLLLARRITNSLRTMTQVVESMVQGNYHVRVEVDGDDEVAHLAQSFNSLSSELASRVATITTDRNRLSAILGSMFEGVVAVDSEERIVHLNEVAARLLEVRQGDVLGRRLWEVVRLDALTTAIGECLDGEGVEIQEVVLPDEPEDRVVSVHGTPLKDDKGQTSGAVLVLHEVTQIRRLEGMRRDFVANVSHELKTPLAAIQGLSETLIEDDEMPQDIRKRFLKKIRKQTARQTALVNDLLELSRLDADASGLPSMAPCDFRATVDESVRGLQDQAEEKALHMASTLPDHTVTVVGDPSALLQVVDNLISNAIKYTPSGGTVRVNLATDNRSARLSVADTGIGIAPSDQARVFERFYRVDKARSRELGGTGLGLAITKNITLRLGGDLTLESEVGRGSTFMVRLPLAATEVRMTPVGTPDHSEGPDE